MTERTGCRGLCDAAAMVLEIADIAVAQLQASPGFRSARMTRGIESPTRFVLLAEWDDLEAHTVGFRESERFTRWRELIGPFFDGPPRVEHFADVPAAG